MYCVSNPYISIHTGTLALTKVYIWFTNNGKASWTINTHQRYQQGTKPASGKIVNYFSSYSYTHSNSYSCIIVYFMIAQSLKCSYCSINNTNKWSLFVSSALLVKEMDRVTIYYIYPWIREKTLQPWTSVFISSSQTIVSFDQTY